MWLWLQYTNRGGTACMQAWWWSVFGAGTLRASAHSSLTVQWCSASLLPTGLAALVLLPGMSATTQCRRHPHVVYHLPLPAETEATCGGLAS